MSLDFNKEKIKLIYDTALKLLARREYAKKELSLKIQQKYFNENIEIDVINQVIEYLQIKNYQSDLRYAEMLCKTRINQKYGNKRISYELSEHGIDKHIISEILAQHTNIWIENILSLIEKKSLNLNETKQREKIKSYLLQKGYDLSVINKAINIYLGK